MSTNEIAERDRDAQRGFIGAYIDRLRGGDLGALLNQSEVQFVAVCDCQRANRDRAKNMVDGRYGNKDCAAYRDMRDLLAERADIDAVLIGCPYPTVEEIGEVAAYIQGRKVKKNIKFCIFAPEDVVNYSRQLGYIDIIEGAGGDIMQGECVVSYPTKEWKWKRVMTNSAKYAVILPSDPTWLDVWYADTRECVAVATTKK